MSQLHVDDVVRLTTDLPELSLQRGLLGVVRSTWFEPTTRYDVEFATDEGADHTRALVTPEQLERQADDHLVALP